MTIWPFAIILSPVAVLATVWALIQWRRSMDQLALAGGVPVSAPGDEA